MKDKKILIIIFLLALFIPKLTIHAANNCDEQTNYALSQAAAHVEAKYEMVPTITDYAGVPHPEISEEVANTLESGYVFLDITYLRVLNVPENIYFTIDNDYDNIHETHYASDLQDGVFTYQVPDNYHIRKYDIKIYSNDSNCLGKELNKITITTPMFNEYSTLNVCEDQKDKYYCQPYVTSELNLDENIIFQNFKDDESNSHYNKKTLNIFIIIGIVLAIALIGGIVVVLIKRRRQEK